MPAMVAKKNLFDFYGWGCFVWRRSSLFVFSLSLFLSLALRRLRPNWTYKEAPADSSLENPASFEIAGRTRRRGERAELWRSCVL